MDPLAIAASEGHENAALMYLQRRQSEDQQTLEELVSSARQPAQALVLALTQRWYHNPDTRDKAIDLLTNQGAGPLDLRAHGDALEVMGILTAKQMRSMLKAFEKSCTKQWGFSPGSHGDGRLERWMEGWKCPEPSAQIRN